MTGAALFRPHQDTAGVPAGDRDTQTQGGQLAPVSCCVGPQVGRCEGGSVLVQDMQPTASRADGTAGVSVRQPYQGLGVPRAASQQGWSPPAALADLPQEPAASLCLPRPRASLPASSRASSADPAQPVAVRASAACSNCRAVTCGGPFSLSRDDSSTNRASVVQCGRCWRANSLIARCAWLTA